MIYQECRNVFREQGVFTTHQLYSWRPKLDKNTPGRWVKKGLLLKLRNGLYAFPDYAAKPNFTFFAANRMYLPSYISTFTALSFYGLIPEAITNITSVSPKKTTSFENALGVFQYHSINRKLMFGFDLLPFDNGKSLQIAKPEKALLDLLHLYPFYRLEDDMEQLRLDSSLLTEIVNEDLLINYARKFENEALMGRLNTLLTVYEL
jgi:predicted transcriptional regulator of viral defense system